MAYIANNNFGLDASLGLIDKYSTVNKFGESTKCDSGIPTDIYAGEAIPTIFSTIQAKLDIATIISDIEALTVTGTHSITYTTETITPGVYTTAGATTFTGVLTLDGGGDADSVFIIRTGAALSTSASASFVLTNSANAANVHFVVNGAIALGANSVLVGNLISKGFAISSGASCTLNGRLLTTTGAVAYNGTLTKPTSTAFNVDYRELITLIMFTGSGAISSAGASVYTGNIATDLGAVTGFESATLNGTIYLVGINSIPTYIWIPPTAASVHNLASTSVKDDSAGAGVRTVKIHYLPDWDSAETTITLTMSGTSNVSTPSLVMINRMEALTWGAEGVSGGNITATSSLEGTVTSVIMIGQNQTKQFIYGVPSTQKLRVTKFFASLSNSVGGSQSGDGQILTMIDPATNATNNTAWISREDFLLVEENNPWAQEYGAVPKKFDGPCIVKAQVTTNSNNSKCIGSFDAFLYTV